MGWHKSGLTVALAVVVTIFVVRHVDFKAAAQRFWSSSSARKALESSEKPPPLPDPYYYDRPPCRDDEVEGKVSSVPIGGGPVTVIGVICSPRCSAADTCTTAVPPTTNTSMTNVECAFQYSDGKNYCGLFCDNPFKGGGCPAGASCIASGGLCMWPPSAATEAAVELTWRKSHTLEMLTV
eukprot:gnl/TRDRNA2_/TRDRNA2_192738_c0_seq1.p1 gnl/TRDRNA2_/TRDRNA2_192738_c0~~gnl/TRDRNA2_/TRDRNA2_192738_c0_seq1.p1  ORF type:complete len:181 (-),score=28.73 gnl/TRDRNA2_/TRDRNA2_192738_c0_seq1:153-695(-)